MTRISMGLLSAILSMLKMSGRHRISKKHDLISYMQINYVDINLALELACKCSWIELSRNDLFYLTEKGCLLASEFDGLANHFLFPAFLFPPNYLYVIRE